MVDIKLMTPGEVAWLDTYHQQVWGGALGEENICGWTYMLDI